MDKLEFYIDNFIYISNIEGLDFSFIPSLLKRRLSPLNKATFYTLEKCLNSDVENFVYASRYGEFDKLKNLINSFSVENCVSPTMFSSSVHNASIGAFLHKNKLNKPYVALAATQNTLSMALLQSVINPYKVNLFCYSDYIDDEPFSIAMLINKKPIGKRFLIDMKKNEQLEHTEEIPLLVSLLNNEVSSIQFDNYKIEAL